MRLPQISTHTVIRILRQIALFNVILFLINTSIFLNGGNVLVQTLTLAITVLLPGVLLISIFNIQGAFGAKLGYTVAFGLSYLVFLGLIINTALPLVGIKEPLGILPFFVAFNISMLLIFSFSLVLKKNFSFSFTMPHIQPISAVFASCATAFPIIMLLGMFLLNNGGSNILILIALLGIAVYIIFVVIFRKLLQDFVFPLSIFAMSLALLFMYSARSSFLVGWDIQNEYRIFLHTLTTHQWNPQSKGNIYNATLGVTILPTLLSNILTVPGFYLFKYVYPIFFAFSSLAFYYVLRQYLSRASAFLGAFFCICQLSYVSMPSLARQEIGYLLFAYILFILFDKVNSRFVKNDVILFLGLAMVLTHYSTTYVALFLFLATCITGYVIKGIFHIFPKISVPKTVFNLNIFVVLILGCVTVLWYGYYTEATQNVDNFFTAVKRNLTKVHTEEGKTQQSLITITGYNREATPEDLKKYIAIVTQQYRFDPNNLSFFPMSVVDKYPVRLVKVEKIKGDPVLEKLGFNLTIYDRQVIKGIMVLGLLYMGFLFLFKKKQVVSAEVLVMGYIYLFFIVLAIFVPAVSKEYNIERLYQQGLLILVFFLVGIVQATGFKKWNLAKYLFLSIIFIIYFFSYHGIIIQFTGGAPSVNLNNYGDDFGQYYIYDGEIKAANWYFLNRNPKLTLYTDQHAQLRLASQGRVENVIASFVPAIIFKESYLYVSHKNKIDDYTQVSINGITINYTFPKQFLQDNKSLIYTNGTADIYK